MTGSASWFRFVALLSAGALGVHQLRYLVTYGDGAGTALEHSGHGYLAAVEPLVGMAVALVIALALHRVAAGRPGVPLPTRGRLASMFGIALLLTFVGQELIEGELAAGHASGLAGVFGAGGWVAVPLALVVGALASLFVRAAEAALPAAWCAARLAVPRAGVVLRGSRTRGPARASLPRHLAGRGPPLLLSL